MIKKIKSFLCKFILFFLWDHNTALPNGWESAVDDAGDEYYIK